MPNRVLAGSTVAARWQVNGLGDGVLALIAAARANRSSAQNQQVVILATSCFPFWCSRRCLRPTMLTNRRGRR
jgi:hypothetical protein